MVTLEEKVKDLDFLLKCTAGFAIALALAFIWLLYMFHNLMGTVEMITLSSNTSTGTSVDCQEVWQPVINRWPLECE